MLYRLLIHDLLPDEAAAVFPSLPEDVRAFAAEPMVARCVGCFGCWIKTPGACVIKDRASVLPSFLGSCRELILVSRCRYGGVSPTVKAAMERSIGCSLPFFHLVGGEMHHPRRYDNKFTVHGHFYGDINDAEREIATGLIAANALNLSATGHEARFYPSPDALKGAVL